MKYFRTLDTDYYQLTMVLAYIINGTAKDTVGFEGFYRHAKPDLPRGNYIFATHDLSALAEEAFEEVKSQEYPSTFLALLRHRIPSDRYESYSSQVESFFADLRQRLSSEGTVGTYSVYPTGVELPPYVPFFQYSGERWLGQLLETPVLVASNGPTGLATQKTHGSLSPEQLSDLEQLVYSEDVDDPAVSCHLEGLRARAAEYRASTDRILLDASYRRAPSSLIAAQATKIALDEGWDGSAHAGAAMTGLIPVEKTGGTHAHSFVMGNLSVEDSELAAFRDWDRAFPSSTILVDTYDVSKAISKLIANNIKPADIRIDSQPLMDYLPAARQQLDSAGWFDVGLFPSGDLTPAVFLEYERNNIPYDKAMAGTQYVNYGLGHLVNAGFVYKLVEIEDKHGLPHYPEKKATGKVNYSGLKSVSIDGDRLLVDCRPEEGFGINVHQDANFSNTEFITYEPQP